MPGRVNNKTFVISKNTAANKGGGGDPPSPAVRCDSRRAANKPPAIVRKPMARVSGQKPPTQKPAARSPAAAPSKVDGGGSQWEPFGLRAPPPRPSAAGAAASPQPAKVRGPPAAGMARCPLCERNFTADRLPKHEEVCRNVRDREGKRKVFDGRKQRLQCLAEANGCDLLTLKKKVEQEDRLAAEKQLQKKKDESSRKRGELFRSPQTACQPGAVRDHTDSMVRCPHCSRTFAEAPAERHIPGCGERTRAAADRAKNRARR